MMIRLNNLYFCLAAVVLLVSCENEKTQVYDIALAGKTENKYFVSKVLAIVAANSFLEKTNAFKNN